MSIERLITCPCGHCVDDHEAGGCTAALAGFANAGADRRPACPCPYSRRAVIDALLDIEKETIHQEWRSPRC